MIIYVFHCINPMKIACILCISDDDFVTSVHIAVTLSSLKKLVKCIFDEKKGGTTVLTQYI